MAHAQRVFSLEDRHRFIITQDDLEKAIELTLKNNMGGSEIIKPPFGMYL
jgi:hypothetical protein